MGDTSGKGKSPIGINEAVAIGMGAVALLRIRRRRKAAAAEEAAAREKQAEEGNSGKPGTTHG